MLFYSSILIVILLRLLRNRNYGSTTNTENTTVSSSNSAKQGTNVENVTLLPICHPAIPDLQHLSSMVFEAIFLLYLHTALFCQYIYLYKVTHLNGPYNSERLLYIYLLCTPIFFRLFGGIRLPFPQVQHH